MDVLGSTVSIAADRVAHSWPWYITRGSGFVAAALLFCLILSGIGQYTGFTFRFLSPLKVWALHKAMGLSLCAAVALHVLCLLIDKFMPFDLLQITVPFTSHYNNGSKLPGLALGGIAVTLGVFAMYGIAIIVLSSLGWINSKRRTWHFLHYISYAVVICIFLHALYVGTDLKYGSFRTAWIVVGSTLVIGVVFRLSRAFTVPARRKKPDPTSDNHQLP